MSYPESRRQDQVDTYHGVAVADPYRWLENLDGAAIKDWVEAQNALSQPYLEQIPGRDRIKRRLTEFWNYERYGTPFKEGGQYFYTRNDGLQDQSVLYVVAAIDAEPRVLIDPNTFSQDATISLGDYKVSPDGRHIAYSLSDGGSDWKTWKVRAIDSGRDLDDKIAFTKFTGAAWSKDSQGFYYSRYPAGQSGHGDGGKSVAIYYHLLGDQQSDDRLIYDIEDHPRRDPYPFVSEDGRYLVISVWEGYNANGLYYLDLHEPGAGVVRLLDEWDALYFYCGNDGPIFYFQTNRDAPMSRLVAIDIRRPQAEQWREIIAESAQPLQGVSLVGDHFVAEYLKDAHSHAVIYDKQGHAVRQVAFADLGSAGGFGGKADNSETFYSFTSFTAPPAVYRYNVATGESQLFARAEMQGGIKPEDFTTKQIFYHSKDGTRVPMFIVHRHGLELDGANPTLLYGYGGFDISLTPYYSASWLVWLEMGGVLAIPNLRGGGEYGHHWHMAGTKLDKQNVFDDFIAAAQWLVDNSYTSPPKLAIQGGSNGGLLVGAVMTQRPELFGAALPAVGVLDMLRYHTASANARNWSSDYGLSEDEEEFKALYAYSPYHNLQEGVCYPPTLITTADHDDRVVPWHSFKFAAALQNAQGCDQPILIRVETRAGHGAGTPTWMQIENIADQWAFLAQTLGMKGQRQ
ncbi:MAG: prolyl oligopeptidase family serine peptidase [Candidatus Latescibacteria bacterium]|nr:prolyl oligopeptidase family serine peptidase [Candidatus Latescibacterota bacterium]